ncbi:MAG: hypothetical protein WCL70_06275 [Paludibacter sp.]
MKFNYLGPFIHGVAEFRINGEVGFVNKYGERVDMNGERDFRNSNSNNRPIQSVQLLIASPTYKNA